jgi:hypothetical protein
MQKSEIIYALRSRTRIACVGQRLMQFMHPMHLSESSLTELNFATSTLQGFWYFHSRKYITLLPFISNAVSIGIF